jgi:hypothetical protein
VSRQDNVKKGSALEKCLAGYTYRVKVTIDGKTTISDVNTLLNDLNLRTGVLSEMP